jgi:hypothetical protein
MSDEIDEGDDDTRGSRRRSSDRFLPKFGGDLIKIAIALVIAWFGVRERVSNLERDIGFARYEITILRADVNYLRSRIDGINRSSLAAHLELPDGQ